MSEKTVNTQINPLIEEYMEGLLQNSTPEHPLWNQEMIRQNGKAHWNYIDGCMITAFLTLFKSSGDFCYLDFSCRFIDFFVREDGRIDTYREEEYNLDNINEGRCLFVLYENTGKNRYRLALDNIYRQIQNQPRTREGNFWHKKIYPHQVWLDGIYMALPFYLEYEKRFNSRKNYPDILRQIRNTVKYMKDSRTGLYYHACDFSHKMFWSNRETGLSENFWLRAMGWYVMALVDILEILDEKDRNFRHEISLVFRELINSLLTYQDKTGMWYQVIDKAGWEGNYPETSGTAIIAYAILKAVHLRILPESFRKAGMDAFQGICRTYLYRKNGELQLGGICLVAGLGGKEKRDGSYEYYISEPVVENEAKGIAPFLLAYIYSTFSQKPI